MLSICRKIGLCGVLFFWYTYAGIAHPMPNSVVNFSFGENEIWLKVEVPIVELEAALQKDLSNNQDKILTDYRQEITTYFLQHVKIKSKDGRPQPLSISSMEIDKTAYDFGKYYELVLQLVCSTDSAFDNRDFILDYDAVIHQVVTHFALIKIHQDFENGITPEDSLTLSTIQLDIASNTIKPLSIQLEKGSNWKGFKKMVQLGMHHIYTGFDHLLFICLLLVVLPLRLRHQKWGLFGGWSYTFGRLWRVITAFTVGHCITLLVFSLANLSGFSQPIEIMIALTIILTALHVLRPLFFNKELYITFLFGLIHGSAFGISLSQWGVSSGQQLWSLLGFNVGIELMQLIVVVLGLPIIYLSRYNFYHLIRIVLACIALFISICWLAERITNHPNSVTRWVENVMR